MRDLELPLGLPLPLELKQQGLPWEFVPSLGNSGDVHGSLRFGGQPLCISAFLLDGDSGGRPLPLFSPEIDRDLSNLGRPGPLPE